MGLPDILEAVRRRWKLVLLVLMPIVVGGVVYARLLPLQYTAKAVVAFAPRPGSGIGAVDVNTLAEKYVAFVTAPTTVASAAGSLGLSEATLAKAVSAQIPTSSIDLSISVQLRSPAGAQAAATALANAVITVARGDRLMSADEVAPPVLPTAPSAPRRSLLEAAAGLVGLIIAVLVAVAVERGRPRVRSPMEVAFVTGHGVIGRIPASRAVRSGIARALADPLVGGAARSLRTVLDHEGRTNPIHTLVVTSSTPGEGKSTIAGLLAAAIARLDAQVLLIDADLRKPTLAANFELEPRPGLGEVLRGTATLDQAARAIDAAPGLSVLPSAPEPEAGDLIARQMHHVIDDARASYDVVIIDTPPLLLGEDAGTLAAFADGVLLVVSNAVETRRLGEAARSLDTLGLRVIGVVVNRSSVPSYGYSYGGPMAEGVRDGDLRRR